MAHTNDITVSDVFCCRFCQADVALVTLPGGELAYECTSARCGHTVHVDCPDALDVKDEPADLAADAAEAFAALAPAPIDASERKALYHRAQGVAPIAHGAGWLVPSGTRAGVIHFVSGESCSCEAGAHGRARCWHRSLVALASGTRQALGPRAA